MSKIDSPHLSVSHNANVVAAQTQVKGKKKDNAPPPAASDEQTQGTLFASKPELQQPKLDQAYITSLLQKLTVTSFESQLSSEKSITKAHEQRMHDLHKNNVDQLAKALSKQHHHSKAGKIGRIFGWIGAGLGILAGVILIVVTLGTGSPIAAALIAASVALAVAMIILEATGVMDQLNNKLAGGIEDMLVDCGVDPSKAESISKIAARVIIAVVVIAIQIALAIASGGAASGASAGMISTEVGAEAAEGAAEVAGETAGEVSAETASAAGEATAESASSGTEAASETSSTVSEEIAEEAGEEMAQESSKQLSANSLKAIKWSARATYAAQAGSEAGGAGADAASAVYAKQASDAIAKMTDNTALIRKLEAMMEDEQQTLREVFNALMGTNANMAKLIRDENDNRAKLADFESGRAAV